ncbi:MAG: NADH-quinone oxidoreductase subunit L [Bacteroidia bacterium]|nr:NADH-quinone oxidoreductase subunit L [Bacteroidia bacterium]
MDSLIVLLIPLLPLIGFIISGTLNKQANHTLINGLTCGSVFVSFLLSVILFYQLQSGSAPISYKLLNWIYVGALKLDLSFTVDALSSIMLLIITGIGFLIHVYSTGYMHDEPDYARFFSYLNLFVFFMLLLVMGNNFVVMFVGWEGVGLCSYLLIGFWFKNNAYNDAAKKAFVMNRIGDLGFLIGMFLILNKFGSLNYQTVFDLASHAATNDPTITVICICLFIGALGKSAQIPLYTWLPDAMAGPTPVSALIHAATMVTAGIYMIVRTNVLYTLSPDAGFLVAVMGVATALFAATIGLKQNDIKKVLAYSTVSQLGYMFAALGVGAYETGMFHVITHAFFKALLFLCAGSVIHAMSGEQDIRSMGGLRKKLPITHITFFIGTLAISGFPPFSGFFSKDEILAKVHEYNGGFMLFTILAITSVITAFYMFRLYWLTFWGNFRGNSHQASHLHESPKSITIPLILLAVFAASAGLIGLPHLFHAPHLLNNFLAPVIINAPTLEASASFEIALIVVSLIVLALVTYITYQIYVAKARIPVADADEKGISKWVANKYYIDELYNALITQPLQAVSTFANNYIEKYVIDGTVNSFRWLTNTGSLLIRQIQTGSIGLYIFGIVIGIICMFVFKFYLA